MAAFCIIETKVAEPMFRLQLFKIRAFTAGVFASFLAALSRGGLMFMLVIWLQGIWLPLHGYDFARTPLWAGIAMIPLTMGLLISGPVTGILSDRYGARPFATGGMIGAGDLLRAARAPAHRLLLLGLRAPALPPGAHHGRLRIAQPDRGHEQPPARAPGAGSGMNTTFQNSAQVFSIGIFFTLMIVGLSATLPHSLYHGLVGHGVPAAMANRAAHLPPVSTLFAAFLGYNPVEHLIGAGTLAHLSPAQQRVLLGHGFFPSLITGPFQTGLHAALDFAIVASVLAAAASWSRGTMYVHSEPVITDRGVSAGPSGDGAAVNGAERGAGAAGNGRTGVASTVGGRPDEVGP